MSAPVMLERDLQRAVLEMAHVFGWLRAHFRPAKTEKGWRTPVEADGTGFPDLVLIRESRLVVAELKSGNGRVRPDQQAWLSAFRNAGAETYLWRPKDLHDGTIEHVLKRTRRSA